jgi:recombination protein RecA
VRLDIRRIESIKDGVEIIGSRTRVKVVKNKCVAAGTTVFDPVSGLTHRIEEIVECGAGEAVVAADKVGTLHARPIVQRFDQGEAEVIGLHLRDGTELWVTPDHKVMTDQGWREAGALTVGDTLARPRRAFGFGDLEPVGADAARLLGYLLGRGHAGGATPCAFVDLPDALHADAGAIAAELGAEPRVDGRYLSFANGAGDRPNGVLELARRAGLWDLMPSEARVPAELMGHDVSEAVVSNLVFGLLETTGRLTRHHDDVGLVFTTPSEQLAHQLHWLLLRWGIGSTVRAVEAGSRSRRRGKGGVPAWDVTVTGVDDVARFAEVVATWGPQGADIERALGDPALPPRRATHRDHLPADQTEPVLAYLEGRGLEAAQAATIIGVGVAGDPGAGLAGVLGAPRLRRDRLEALAAALDSEFLRGVLAEDVWYDRIVDVRPAEWRRIYDIEVDEHHTFVADGVVVSNCAPPFRQCEFDIMYGTGVSREGSLVDIGVDLGIVKKSGAWYTYEGEQLGQGRENAKNFLAENLDVMMEIDQRIRRQSGLDGEAPEAVEGDDALDPDDQPITLD